jgi:hypothetical protein
MLQPRSGDLTILRTLFVAFGLALAIALVVIPMVPAGERRIAPSTALVVIAAAAATSISVAGVLKRRPLRGTTSAAVAGSYRVTFFLLLALAEAVAALAVVSYFLGGSVGTYFLGIGLALPGYAMAAPTTGDIARHQERLNQRGAGADLLGGLLQRPD